MLKVVEYIKENGLEALSEKLSIKVKRHKDFDNLCLLKYNQLDSPMGNLVVQQCRGIILDEANDWRVVSYPYDKFFNHGEGHAAEIDWSTARVYEKLDGSLVTLYYYANHWHVASSGLPDAWGEVMGTDTTFKLLFWEVWHKLGYQLPTNTDHCYMFELMTPYNRVVVRHPEPKLVLHGGRKLSDFSELNPVVEAHLNGWECVKIHPLLGSFEDIMETAKELDPMESEGYVVCDANYNRVKVKSPQYVAISHLKDSFTTRRLLEIVRTNENSEFLSYYPEYSELFWDIKAKYERLVGYIEGYYDAVKHLDDRKTFALAVKDFEFSGVLFKLKFGNTEGVRESLFYTNIKHLEDWLGLKSVEL